MALEQVYKCSRTLNKLRSGPLGGFMDGFCGVLLQSGFNPGTARRHLQNVCHLSAYLGTRDHVADQVLSGSRGLLTTITKGGGTVMALAEDQF